MYRAGTGNFGEFSPYTINFRGLCKSGGARAPAAPPSSAPMNIVIYLEKLYIQMIAYFLIISLQEVLV